MMKHRTVLVVLLGVCVLLLPLANLVWPRVVYALHHYEAEAFPVPATFVRIPTVEPSGVAYHTPRGTLLVVSDEGQLVELDREFKVLQAYDIPGDIEGVSVHPATGTVFIAIESDDAIIEYDLDERRVLRTLLVDLATCDDFKRSVGRNKGLEGVAVVSESNGDYRLIAAIEKNPARLVVLSADVSVKATERVRGQGVAAPFVGVKENVTVVASHDVGLARISDVAFDAETRRLIITASGARTMTIADLDGRPLRSVRLPGKKPEGVCFLPDGDGVVANDTGGMFVCRGLRSALWHKELTLTEP